MSAQEAANGKEVDADVREIAYCLAVARGGESAYEAMLSLYLSVRCRCQSPCGFHSLFACVSANVTDILTIRVWMSTTQIKNWSEPRLCKLAGCVRKKVLPLRWKQRAQEFHCSHGAHHCAG